MASFLQNLRKFAVLAIVTLSISLSLNAQEWYILGKYMWSAPHPTGEFREIHYVGEDVVIVGLEYQTIYIQNPNSGTSLAGAFRNEDEQVYYCKWNGSSYDEEVLLYDYSLEVGDTFNDEDDHWMQVTEVSTITDLLGVHRKKLTFKFNGLEDATEFWIEGVGSSKGFMYVGMYEPVHNSDGEMYHLLCYHLDSDVAFVNPEYNECDLPYSTAENTVGSNVTIYPNPASDFVNILNDNKLNITNIEIIDLTGRIVMSTDKAQNINISKLSEGQYFVKIYSESTIVKKLFITK